jgi:hyaluronoglucosaminidase
MLSFDDVKEGMKDKDRGIYGTDYAQAHMELANALLQEAKAADPKFELWFAPTKYSGLKDNHYWQTLRGKLDPSIQVIWTGPAILSKSITSEQADQVAKLLGRKPLIWDNYPVNDYTYEIEKRPQLLMGPIEARDGTLSKHTAGLLANPMIQPEASKIALFTIGKYLQSPAAYSPEQAWNEALQSMDGIGDPQKFALFCTYSRASMLEEQNTHFLTQANVYWNEYVAPKLKKQPINEAGKTTLLTEFGALVDLPKSLRATMTNQGLWQEIEPWAQKLAKEGKIGLLAVKMLDLEPQDPKRQELRKQVEVGIQALEQDPLLIGEEIVEFAKAALQK